MQTDWRQLHHGPLHDGYNPKENVLDSTNVAKLRVLWNAAASGGGVLVTAPVVVDGMVYICSSPDTVHFVVLAFDAASGQQAWSTSVAGSIFDPSSPAVADGVLYVSSGFPTGNVYAFKAATGEPMWTAPTDGAVVTFAPTVADGITFPCVQTFRFLGRPPHLAESAPAHAAGSSMRRWPATAISCRNPTFGRTKSPRGETDRGNAAILRQLERPGIALCRIS